MGFCLWSLQPQMFPSWCSIRAVFLKQTMDAFIQNSQRRLFCKKRAGDCLTAACLRCSLYHLLWTLTGGWLTEFKSCLKGHAESDCHFICMTRPVITQINKLIAFSLVLWKTVAEIKHFRQRLNLAFLMCCSSIFRWSATSACSKAAQGRTARLETYEPTRRLTGESTRSCATSRAVEKPFSHRTASRSTSEFTLRRNRLSAMSRAVRRPSTPYTGTPSPKHYPHVLFKTKQFKQFCLFVVADFWWINSLHLSR